MKLCGYCLKNECECGMKNYQDIDDDIVDVIIQLNNKGYNTNACCSGHPESKDYGMYIAFCRNCFPPIEFLKKYKNLKYYHSVGTIYANIPSKESYQNKEKILYKAREEIRQLAKELPGREKRYKIDFGGLKLLNEMIGEEL